jgi:magnesium chelatase subunit D
VNVRPEAVLGGQRRKDHLERAALGRRARSRVRLRQGKYSRHRLARRHDLDIAFDATLRAAAARAGRTPISVGAEDLRRKVREHRSPFAVCIVVDNSYSVHAERMVEKVKGLTFRLLEDSAHRGDKVALVAFKGGLPEATVALPLTRSRALALRRLRAIPISGRTPLADALERGRRLLRQERFKHQNAVPVLIAVTDGLPTVPLRPGGDPLADVLAEGRALRRAKVACIVVDASRPGAAAQASCGRELARASGGMHLPLAEVAPDAFLDVLGQIT